MNLTQTADHLLDVGLSVIPIIMPGKRPTVSWEEYQTRLPRHGELHFNGSIALICGKVSGNVEVFDVDLKHDVNRELEKAMPKVFGDFWKEIKDKVLIQKTISGGYHFIYKCEVVQGNQKLARNKKGEVTLETRGEGGYVVIAPTEGYKILYDGSFDNIPTISVEDRERLLSCARLLNEFFEEVKIPTSKKITKITQGTKPWDAYDSQTDVTDLLQKHGWTFVKTHGKVEFWKRPGDSDSVWSGSWCAELNTFYVYTSSAPPLQAEKAYTPYALLTFFEFGGDFSASAKELLKQGFGSTQAVVVTSENGVETTEVLTRIKKLEIWLNEHYDFRRNVITSLVWCRLKGKSWQECNEKQIWRHVQHQKIKDVSAKLSDINNLIDSEFVPDFNPIKDYFSTLRPWDNVDHITNLASHVITTDQEFWLAQFKKALVRMIACTVGNVVNRIVMTLVGETQESGKSTFIRFLCPPELNEHYKEEPMLHDKDSEIALAENFMWNLEELDELNKQQISAMKAIISRQSVKQRRAYARHEKSMKRIVNFWGSTNKQDFLTDTQNSRWLCFGILGIDHDYNNTVTGVRKVDINKVWAQAYHLYKEGFSYQLQEDDRQKRDTINHDFETMPEEKQLIIRYFGLGKPGDGVSKFMVNFDIKEHLNQNTSQKNKFDERNIGRSMKQLGFIPGMKKQNDRTVRGYWVKILANINRQNSPEKNLFSDEIDLPF
jgi:predicted P-loop ATPase